MDSIKKSRVIPGNAQHIGAREEQQDSFGFSDFENTDFVNSNGILAVVADGMGGMRLGKEASSAAVKKMLSGYMNKLLSMTIPEKLKSLLFDSNDAVQDMAQKAGLDYGVGTTLVAAAIHNGELYWISSGDSRIYLYRKRRLFQLTADHIYAKLLSEEVALGKTSKEDAEMNPDRNKLTSYLGKPDIDEIDRNEKPFLLRSGDKVLLCSDGLYGNLTVEEILSEMEAPSQLAAEALVRKVLLKNQIYQDNLTAVVLEYI